MVRKVEVKGLVGIAASPDTLPSNGDLHLKEVKGIMAAVKEGAKPAVVMVVKEEQQVAHCLVPEEAGKVQRPQHF